MAIQYVRPKMWKKSWMKGMKKKIRIDTHLKALGVKRRMPMTRIIDMALSKPLYLDSEQILKISRRRKFEI